ncbi:porin family protein [Cellulophaga sp. Hel_I_12]|uniref:porin family protein n=1 Tax=Cellulophaga sp. Hel_I_12 TaxID=1249972 RepID=UPI00064648C9|nr:porin family protein [Cellulophaga sp. Hel_I_12]
MKKIVVLAIVLATGASAMAQTWSNKVQVGVKAGLNFATVAGNDFESPDGRTSFYGGLLVEVPVTDIFSFQSEVFYSGQGFDITNNSNQDDAAYQVDYIQVPLLLKVYLIDGLNIHAGPQFGFKVNEEIDFDPNADGGDIDTDAVKDFDFQLTTGVEYKFSGSVFIQARYSYGFSEMIENLDVHNSYVSAGIGFMF